jgi:hypothetical protein
MQSIRLPPSSSTLPCATNGAVQEWSGLGGLGGDVVIDITLSMDSEKDDAGDVDDRGGYRQ